MNRMIRAATAVALLTSGLGSLGCVHTSSGYSTRGNGEIGGSRCRNVLDPCYPERYEFAARQAVIGPFAQQVHNGYVLNQTLWNYYFEAGTDKLTAAGTEKLDSLVRSQPVDAKLYIQTARDLLPNIDPAKIPDARADLDVKRAAAIQKYLSIQPAFAGPIAFEVYVHDAKVPSINAEFSAGAYRGSAQGYRGGISGAAGIGALGTGGSTNLTVAPVINNSPAPR
jgi:hypothetical protein